MYVVQIFLPLNDQSGLRIPQARFEQAATELSQRFGGLTAYTRAPAKGVWRKAGRRAMHDDIVIYEVICPRLQRRWWKATRLKLEKAFDQESILIRGYAITQL